MIGILTLIIVIVIIGVIVISNNNKGKVNEENKQENEVENRIEEENVNVLQDGTRINKSDKLHETKSFEGMEISNFQLTEKDNLTLLLGTVTNTSDSNKGGYPVEITVVDKEGNEIITVSAFIGELKPGESTQLSTTTTFDYANAYDFRIKRK